MGNIQQRPFAGTWKLNNRSVVKYTPDALIFVNGDTSLPGCARCRGRIEVQKFVTGFSVEAGTDPTSHSATVNLSLPRVQGQQVFIDGYNILRAGLEIHIFVRGYFPIRGMFSHLANPQTDPVGDGSPTNSNRLDLTKYATHPYYPVFHGLITQVSYEYSDGFYHGTLSCTSLLHFWQFVNITTAGAWMAQDKRPVQDPGRPTLYGNNFNNTHPFSIIYTLYRSVAGSAAGVDFALGEASNHDAVVGASVGNDGRQIFSMVAMYWEQRFKTRIQNLRMYGVNGQLFNAAQQAWLGTNRDVDGLLQSSTANDPATTNTTQDPFAARYSVAKALGLQGAGTDFTYSPLIQQDNEFFNLSILDMFAFNQAIGEMGAGNLWQSQYQTKMDIAQKVMEVTGYEFYQDVDGDLVFKPPFWNLDTAPNRYYRLEDSDIINITFTEKEPNATYIIVRGVWVAGFTDATPTDGVLLKRGLYIDYKLVAQFGWRAAPTLELTYVIDPKVLFWIGVARLDMLNVDTFSASASIPIRAELRPGYPVYIPFVDSYYYIRQLSHSFSFGGQCTTNLVLTCRRSKWHAPGLLKPAAPGQSAISLIHLDRPDLPPRPLEIFVNDIPRIVGFPNVVMALDPQKFNPNFSVVGIGIDYFDSVEAPGDLLWGMLLRDIHLLNRFADEATAPAPDGSTVIEDPTQITSLRLLTGPGPDDYIRFTLKDLQVAFLDYQSARSDVEASRLAVEKQEQVVRNLDQSDAAFKLSRRAAKTKLGQAAGDFFGGAADSGRKSEYDRLDNLRGEAQDAAVKYNDTLSSGSVSTLVQVLEALQPNSNAPIRRKIDGIPGSDVRLSYFETLSHLKGQYMGASLPGQYRYFSCSHPFESQQGMPIIEWSDGERSVVGRKKKSGQGKGTPKKKKIDPVTQARFNSENAHLQALLDARDVSWVSASDLLLYRNTHSSLTKKATLEADIATSLANIAQGTQELVNRLAARPDFGGKGLRVKYNNSWRPDTDEDEESSSQHTLGKAMDILVANSVFEKFIDIDGITTGVLPELYQTGYEVLKDEASKMYSEGWFNGFGFYEKRTNETELTNDQLPFVHVDVRNKGKGTWAEVQAVASYKTDAQINSTCIDSLETKGFNLGAKAEACLKKRRDCIAKIKACIAEKKAADQSTESCGNIASCGSIASCAKLLPPDARAEFEACVKGQKTFRDRAKKASADQRAKHPRKQSTTLMNYPINPKTEPATPSPATQLSGIGQFAVATDPDVQVLKSPPKIQTRDLSLEVPRTVVQFLTTTKSPGKDRRAPEVILGIGPCSKGLYIALGPNRAPQVVTTDQIQRISFVRHEATKFTEVVGTSQSSGATTTFNAEALQKQVYLKFEAAIPDDPSVTIASAFESVYEQMNEDLSSVPIPVFGAPSQSVDPSTGALVSTDSSPVESETSIELVPFPDALIVEAKDIPPSIIQVLTSQGVEESDQYLLSELTFEQLSMMPGYTSSGDPQGNGQGWSTTAKRVASAYATKVVTQIESGNNIDALQEEETAASTAPWAGYIALQKAALEPSEGKEERQSAITQAVTEATNKAFGTNETQTTFSPNTTEDKTPKQGATQKAIHTPVFPVSDEKGYEHYGAYRYGRGLSIEPGGTFEFLHSGKDPFRNVTAQSAEEFLRVFTLVKSGKVSADSSFVHGIDQGQADAKQFVLSSRDEPLGPDGNVDITKFDLRSSSLLDTQVEQSVLDLAQVITHLGQTARGQDVLRELLRSNGDNPDILQQDSFDISDTQFVRNFVNYAVNFGKSPVFKTTAANAAYRLADLTTHLLDRAGQSCVCRGSYADVSMEAYSRENFLTVPGVDPAIEPAEAFAGEQAIQLSGGHSVQQQRMRGAILEGPQPDANATTNAGGQLAATGGALGSSPLEAAPDTTPVVSAENPPTTADPNDFPLSDPGADAGVGTIFLRPATPQIVPVGEEEED